MKDIIYVYDKNGNKQKMEVVITFELQEFKRHYIIYREINKKDSEYYAARFNPDTSYSELDTNLSDSEKKIIQKVFEKMNADNSSK